MDQVILPQEKHGSSDSSYCNDLNKVESPNLLADNK